MTVRLRQTGGISMPMIASEQRLSATLKADLDGFSHSLGDVDQHVGCVRRAHGPCGFPKQIKPSRKLIGLDRRVANVRGHEVLCLIPMPQPCNSEPEQIYAVQMRRPIIS